MRAVKDVCLLDSGVVGVGSLALILRPNSGDVLEVGTETVGDVLEVGTETVGKLSGVGTQTVGM